LIRSKRRQAFTDQVMLVASLFMFSLRVKFFPLLDAKFCYNEMNDTYVRFVWNLAINVLRIELTDG
jgi:hypothetical protein